jgi:DNA-binding NarL/FixJ family response regulator
MANKECRIAIVDVYPLFREGVVQAMRQGKNFVVVGEGSTADDAQQIVREKEPDVLLLEAAVAGSLKIAQAILRTHKNVKVAVLASIEDQEHIAQALHIGVHGYIMKGITGAELVRAIQVIRAGERYITADLAWLLVTDSGPAPTQREAGNKSNLSIREQQVIDYTSKGMTNQEIARALGLALGTIKYYKTLAFRKLGVRNRLEAITCGRAIKHS